MSKRSFLYSAAFIGLMAASGAVVPQAQAQKGIALQPATQWAVNKIEASDGQNGYCAMARRFRPNTILTFARNSAEEASFALDFQTPKFRQGDAMEVLLDPGAGQQRAFEVYPVSNQAFVIRLGADGAFFSALEKTGYLRVEFGEKSYNFDLADIDVGQMRLASCVADAIMPAAGDEGTPVLSDNSYRRDIEDLRRQISQLQQTNDQLAVEPVARLTQEYETASNESAGESGGEDSVVIDHLSQQITALEEENQELTSKLKAINGGRIDTLRSDKDVKTIERLTQENQDLRTSLETEQADAIQEAVLQDQIAELEEENRRLRNMSSAEADESGVNPNDVLSLIQENERLKEELMKKSADAGQQYDLRKAISALEEENRTLKVSGGKQVQNESLQQIETLKAENKRLQKVVEASEVTGDPAFIVRELKGQVQKLSVDMQAKEGKMLEMSKLSTEVEMLKTTNEELEKQLIASALRGPVNANVLTERVAALETQNDALLQKIQTEGEVAVETDAVTIESLKAENEELKRVIASNETLVATNKALQEDAERLRKENEELRAQATAAQGGDLAAQLQKAQDDNKTLQAQLQQKENELAELGSLREEVARLKKENEELKTAAQQKSAADPAQPMAANPEVETLHRENENLRAQISGMGNKDSEIADLKTKLQEQEAKIAVAEAAAKKAEESEKTAKADAEKSAKQARDAKEAAKKAEEEIKTAKAQPAAPAPELAPQPEIQAEPAPVVKEEIVATLPTEEPRAQAPTPALEQEMIRLENKLSEAKAGGNQMEIQQAARDYVRLKSKLSASQELAQSSTADDQAAALLAYGGTAKAPVGDVEQVEPIASAPPSEDLLQNSGEPVPTSGMNEAQRQEEAMMNAPPVEVKQSADGNVSMRQSEDPYADMKVEDDFKGYEASADGAVKEQQAAPVKEAVQQAVQEAPQPIVQETVAPDISADAMNAKAGEAYRARMNDARVVTPESVPESYAKSQELMQATDAPVIHAPMAPPPPSGTPSAEWGQATPAAVTSAVSGGIYQPGVAVPQLLGAADVVSPQNVTVVKGASGSDKLSYQWKANEVYGSAVQRPLSDPSRFDGEVQEYLEQTKKRCGQDFAVVPDENSQAGDKRIATYEIACIGQGVNSSASLIFFSQQGTFTVLAHETPADKLDSAMEIRDRLLKAISGS